MLYAVMLIYMKYCETTQISWAITLLGGSQGAGEAGIAS